MALGIHVVALVPATANACSCDRERDEYVRGSELIFRGNVKDITVIDKDREVIRFKVSKVFKGELPSEVEIINPMRSWSCHKSPPVGETAMFFAKRGEDGRLWPVLCHVAQYRTGYRREAYDAQIEYFHREEERHRQDVEADPNRVHGHLALAAFLENWRDREGAVTAYRRAAAVAPEDPRSYAGEGRVLFAMRRFGDARAPLEKAVALDPKDEESGRLLQHCLLNLGEVLDPKTINFRGLWLRGFKLDGQDLPDRDFSDTEMAVSSFRGAHLDRSRFYRARVGQGDFSDASLRDGVLVEVDAEGAKFIHADLTGAKLTKAKLLIEPRSITFPRGTPGWTWPSSLVRRCGKRTSPTPALRRPNSGTSILPMLPSSAHAW